MKVYFDNVDFMSHTGPNTFARRLAQELMRQGHIAADCDDYDIALVFIEATSRLNHEKPFVHRLDGIWFKPDEFLTRNVGIRQTWDHADAIVWQSNFDMQMTTHHWGDKHGTVILNGIDTTRPVTEHRIPEIERLRAQYDHFFTCSSNWHPQKRLTSNIRLFQHLRKNLPGSSCLIIMGSNPQPIIADRDIFYTNLVPEHVAAEIYSSADWMIHLAWLDHSPNVVCEALAQSTPVICSSSGGTRELVQDFGIVLKEDCQYRFELTDYDRPPDIDVEQIDVNSVSRRPAGNHADIDIKHVATRYVDLFENVLQSRGAT